MAENHDELLKKPLYVFDLPHELLVTIHLKDPSLLQAIPETDLNTPAKNVSQSPKEINGESKPSTACQLCGLSFASVQEQRHHVRSDWHSYNLRQKLRGGTPVTENEFEKLVDDLDESLSGSGSDSSESEGAEVGAKESTLSALLKKQANLNHPCGEEEDLMPRNRKRGSGKPPLVWFSTPKLPLNTSLGIYRALFTNAEQEDPDTVEIVRKKQLRPVPAKLPPVDGSNGVPLPSTMTSPSIFMCMIGGGHFAGMIVSLAPKMGKQATGVEQRQAIVIAHKTFHRYTTRRKQGGAQSSNDSAKGAAHSAGASIRRYNEVALEQEIRALLFEWKESIHNAQLIFVRATGSSNRRIIFGPYDGQILRQNDPRNRTFPFSTRRATQAELMRAFVELTRVKVSEVDEAALAAAAADPNSSAHTQAATQIKRVAPPKPELSKEEEDTTLHTSQLQSLIRRSKAPALLSYLTSNSLSSNYPFHPPSSHANHHAPTPLHLASSSSSHAVVLALLTKAGANPMLPNGDGKTAFDLSGDRATRDAFRVARSELGEGKWDWDAAHVPPALSKSEAEKRDQREKDEAEKLESERRRNEEERLRKEKPTVGPTIKKGGKPLGAVPKTAEERREEDARGMTPEMRTRLERERRARAAEERMRRMAG
ncbi:ankyrin repeat and zinc finger domain-containing protein 1, partial [Lecanoromycetidae sp. Uapishka_2]